MITYFYDENNKLNIMIGKEKSKIVINGDILQVNNEYFLFMDDYFYKFKNLKNNEIDINFKLKIYDLL